MARCRADWRQVLDPETGHWCWHSQLRQESRWEKPPIREGWMEWRDANGNAFYVDGAAVGISGPAVLLAPGVSERQRQQCSTALQEGCFVSV